VSLSLGYVVVSSFRWSSAPELLDAHSCGIVRSWPGGLVSARSGRRVARPATPGSSQGRPKAGPKDRAASLTRPPSAAVCAAWPRQRPVRGREQGPGRGAAGEAVPSLRGALGGSQMPRRVWYSRSVGRLLSRLPSLMWSTRRPHANGSALCVGGGEADCQFPLDILLGPALACGALGQLVPLGVEPQQQIAGPG
jgi:hypothetical protein